MKCPHLLSIGIATLLLLSVGAVCSAGTPAPVQYKKQATPGTVKPEAEAKINEYMVRTYNDFNKHHGSFVILRNGKRVYAESESFSQYYINSKAHQEVLDEPGEDNLPKPGEDINGDSIPDLVVERYSGGAHCCYRVSIFSLGKTFKKIADIGQDGQFACRGGENTSFKFKDIDGDKIDEIEGDDWTFAYWKTSFAESPAPTYILRYKNGRYQVALDLMKKPAPSASEFAKHLEEVRQPDSWTQEHVPPELWTYMLDLIYTGNGQSAWDFFDKAWLGPADAKPKFLSEFKEQLSKSQIWPQIKRLNNWP